MLGEGDYILALLNYLELKLLIQDDLIVVVIGQFLDLVQLLLDQCLLYVELLNRLLLLLLVVVYLCHQL